MGKFIVKVRYSRTFYGKKHVENLFEIKTEFKNVDFICF